MDQAWHPPFARQAGRITGWLRPGRDMNEGALMSYELTCLTDNHHARRSFDNKRPGECLHNDFGNVWQQIALLELGHSLDGGVAKLVKILLRWVISATQ